MSTSVGVVSNQASDYSNAGIDPNIVGVGDGILFFYELEIAEYLFLRKFGVKPSMLGPEETITTTLPLGLLNGHCQ